MRLFKQITLAALLLALAVTSFAAPDGWSRINGAWRNDGVAAQSDAIERGGSFYLNLENRSLDIYPWSDGSTDRISMRPVLPNGTSVGELVETNWGWKAPMIGGDGDGWDIWLVDMQATKIQGPLEDFLSDGMALVYGKIPVSVAEAHAGGEWRPKKIKFTAPNLADYSASIQRALTQQEIDEGAHQPKWVEGSIAIYHKYKRNNGGHRKYTTGKIAHLPRPLAVGWKQGQITGWAFGRYEDLGGGVFEKVFDVNGQFNTDMTRNSIGDPVTISVSADVGRTDRGTSDTGFIFTNKYDIHCPTMTENGELVSVTTINRLSGQSQAADIGLYEGTFIDTDTVKTSNLNTANASAVSDGTGYINTWNVPGAVSLSSGVQYSPSVQINYDGDIYFDTGGNFGYRRSVATFNTAFPDPRGTPSHSNVSLDPSMYFTYNAAAATPVTTSTTVTPSSQTKGTDVALTATITDGDNVTTAWEWFAGADPGEGSATAGVMPGGSSPFAVSATIDTTSLPSGANTISVRGFSSDGWGAVDTDTLTLTLEQVVGVTAVGGDTKIDVSWDLVPGATTYFVWYRQISPATSGTFTQTTGDTFEHSPLVNDDTWFYIVRPSDDEGPQPASDSAEVSAVVGVAVGGGDSPSLNLGLGLGL